jgi:hypothetical protein
MHPSSWLIFSVILFTCILVFISIRWLLSIWRLANFVSLLTPEILESVPFFRLVDMLFGRSHSIERHSPMTKLHHHIERAEKGITPEGIQLAPVHSGRWNSYYAMFQAVESSRIQWKKENQKKKVVYRFEFDKTIGFVVKRFTKERIETKNALVVINKQGLVITAFPALESADNTTNKIFLKLSDCEILLQH